MLNTLVNAEPAADARAEFVTGACLPARTWFAVAIGTAANAAARSRTARAARVSVSNEPRKQYLHTTLIAAPSGGTLGPHPAREPV